MSIDEKWKDENNLYCCPICFGKFKKNGIIQHINLKHDEEKRAKQLIQINNINHSIKKGKSTWNKGLTKNDDIRIFNYSEKISKSLKGKKGHLHTKESKLNLSKHAIKNKLGGHTSKKSFYYLKKDNSVVYLQSNYEVIVAKELDKNNIKWDRPKSLSWIDNDNNSHRYYPDFYLIDYDVYLDPKNEFLQKKDYEKINKVSSQNNVIILMLSENQLYWDKIKLLIMPA